MPPSVRRARGAERAPRALAGSFINPAANCSGNGRVHSSSERRVYGFAITATIECVRAERGSVCSQCWPARRLDKHGYIDMGTDSACAGATSWCSTPMDNERCFLAPQPPAPLSKVPHRLHQFHCHPTGTPGPPPRCRCTSRPAGAMCALHTRARRRCCTPIISETRARRKHAFLTHTGAPLRSVPTLASLIINQ